MACKQTYEYLTGSAALLLTSLDIIDAGLLGVVARTSSARRRAILCVLAHVGEAASARIEQYGQPVLCDEVIALRPVARDLRRMPTPALLTKYVPGGGEVLRRALGEMDHAQPPKVYRALARRCRPSSEGQCGRSPAPLGPQDLGSVVRCIEKHA